MHTKSSSYLRDRRTTFAQRGWLMLEAMLVMSIAATAAYYASMRTEQDYQNREALAVGEQMSDVTNATNAYIVDNYQMLVSSASTDITVNTLVSQNLLPSSFSSTNPYGSAYSIHLVRTGTSPNYNIEGLVITTSPWTDGRHPLLPLIGTALEKVGAAGGMTYSSASISGYDGSWSYTSSTYPAITTAGQLGARVGYGTSQFAQFLRRDGTLPMTGNLDMGNKIETSVAEIQLSSAQTANASCSPNGAVARDSTGALLSCVSGTWQRPTGGSLYWKNPVRSYSALPTTDPVGAVRLTTDTDRAFAWNGSSWVALAVDQNGNLTVPGNTIVGGSEYVATTITAGGTITSHALVAIGSGCSPVDSIAFSSSGNGELLDCYNGVWAPAGQDVYNSWVNYAAPNGVMGTWDLGWHRVCFLSEYDSRQQVLGDVYVVAGPNAAGYRDFYLNVWYNGSYGTAAACANF